MIRVASVCLNTLILLTAFCNVTSAAESSPAKKVDLVKGSAIATAVCANCHGTDGNTVGNAYPKLASQNSDYLSKQLTNFKVKAGAKAAERSNTIMRGFASALSEEDVRNVSAYYAGQAIKPATAKNKDLVELGQKIYRGGVADKNIPACAGCHGPNGAGIPAQYPRLGGQWAEYNEAQLIAFRSGTRGNNPVMTAIANRLSDKEIKAVADYTAGIR